MAKCYDEGDFKIVGVRRERGKPAMALMALREGQVEVATHDPLSKLATEPANAGKCSSWFLASLSPGSAAASTPRNRSGSKY